MSECHAVNKGVSGGTKRTSILDVGAKERKGEKRGHKFPGAVDVLFHTPTRLLRSFTELHRVLNGETSRRKMQQATRVVSRLRYTTM